MNPLKLSLASFAISIGATFMVASMTASCGSLTPPPFVEWRCKVTIYVPNTKAVACTVPGGGTYPQTQKTSTTSDVVERGCNQETPDSSIIQTAPGTPACQGQISACYRIQDSLLTYYPAGSGALVLCNPEQCNEETDHATLYDSVENGGGPLGAPLNWPSPTDYTSTMAWFLRNKPLDVDASVQIIPADAGSWISEDASVGPLECNDASAPPPPAANCNMTAAMTGGSLSACSDCFLANCCTDYQTAASATNEGANALADALCWLGEGNSSQFPCPTPPLLPAVQVFDACMVQSCLNASCFDPHIAQHKQSKVDSGL